MNPFLGLWLGFRVRFWVRVNAVRLLRNLSRTPIVSNSNCLCHSNTQNHIFLFHDTGGMLAAWMRMKYPSAIDGK